MLGQVNAIYKSFVFYNTKYLTFTAFYDIVYSVMHYMLDNNRICIQEINSVALIASDPRPQKRIYYGSVLPKYELIYKIAGENYTHFNGETLHMHSDIIGFLPKENNVTYYVDRISLGNCIDIFFDTNSEITNKAFSVDASSNKRVKSLFIKLHSCWISRDNGYYYKCMALLYEILSEIIQPDGNYLPEPKYNKIKPGIDYLHANCFDSEIDYYMPAKLCKISYNYFKRLFCLKYNTTPHAYVTELRLERALELLSTNLYSITDIANMCGYTDIFYFSRVFKNRYGVSPGKYRK